MTDYEEYFAILADASFEQRINIIASESKRFLPSIRGYTMLLRKYLAEPNSNPPVTHDQTLEFCDKIIEYTKTLQNLTDALHPIHRDIRQRDLEIEQRTAESERKIWFHASSELTGLKNASGFFDAILKVCHKLKLPLLHHVQTNYLRAWSSSITFSTLFRRADFQVITSLQELEPRGYAITLSQYVGYEINPVEPIHEGSTLSLDEAVLAIHRWLVDGWELDQIRTEYDWMWRGVVLWQRANGPE